MNPELIEVRKKWFSAYLSGDIEGLSEHESDKFKVISPGGVETKTQRAKSIAAAVKGERWFPVDTVWNDIHLSWSLKANDLVEAIGTRNASTPGEDNYAASFLELWKKSDHKWKIAQIHYSPMGRTGLS